MEQFDHRQNVAFDEWQKSAEHAENVIKQEKAPKDKMQEERQEDRKDNETMDDPKKAEPESDPRKRDFEGSALPSSSGGEMELPPANVQKIEPEKL